MSLKSLARIPPFDNPNIIDHMIENSDSWMKFYSKTDGEAVPLPGPYINMDVDEVSKLGNKQDTIKEENDENVEEEKALNNSENDNKDVINEEDLNSIWDLNDMEDHMDDDDSDDDLPGTNLNKIKNKDRTKEVYQDSLVQGLDDYQEFRYGSVMFEKEQKIKKAQVFKYLLRLCVIRCLRPDRVVPEVNRFLGNVLDPRFMEPPVYDFKRLGDGFREFSGKSGARKPILFILSSSINAMNELQILKNYLNLKVKIHYLPLGSSNDVRVKELILEGAKNGDWVLLENLHLVTDWLVLLEKFIQSMESQNIHPNFRLWLSSMPVDYSQSHFYKIVIKSHFSLLRVSGLMH